jgi:4-oxalocrotonate tautomerase family enzyme
MPTIFFYGPRLEREKKIELIRSFTKAASTATGIREEAFVVYLRETAPDQVGVGGELLEDRLKNN